MLEFTSKESHLLKGLNDNQKTAVINTEGFIRLIAGAGTGKTKTLINRYMYIYEELGIPTDRILCTTFTNKAANQMKEKITEEMGDIGTPYISTFHSFCVKVLIEDIERLGYPKRFKMIDSSDQLDLIKEVYKNLDLTTEFLSYKGALQLISKDCKYSTKPLVSNYEKLITENSSKGIEAMINKDISTEEKIILMYLAEQKKSFYLDFDDLINFALYLFKTNEIVRIKWQNMFDYIQVDEFQDVSMREFELVSILSEINDNLFIVGDPDQTIFEWRNANVDCIMKFENILAEFQNRDMSVKTIELNTNYRSTPEILNVSNSLISSNVNRIKKSLSTANKSTENVIHYHATNTTDEAKWIVDKIKELKRLDKYKLSDVAIIYRANAMSRSVEETLMRNNIQYKVHSGISFFERKEIKDVLAVLSLVTFEDDLSFVRIVTNNSLGIGKKRIEKLRRKPENNNLTLFKDEESLTLFQSLRNNLNNKSFSRTKGHFLVSLIDDLRSMEKDGSSIEKLLDEVVKAFDYEELFLKQDEVERYENILELKETVKNYEAMQNEKVELSDYLGMLTLYTTLDKSDKSDGVNLMTAHTSKGLEFSVVFLIGLNEGVFPNSKIKTIEQMEEERRVAYVGMTRAKDLLFLTEADGFNYNNTPRHISRFLLNIREGLYDTLGDLDEDELKKMRRIVNNNEEKLRQGNNVFAINKSNDGYNVGDKVMHKTFGPGVVVDDVNSSGNVMFIKFENKTRGVLRSSKVIKKI